MVFGAGKLKAEIERLENELRASQTQVQERSQQLTQSDLKVEEERHARAKAEASLAKELQNLDRALTQKQELETKLGKTLADKDGAAAKATAAADAASAKIEALEASLAKSEAHGRETGKELEDERKKRRALEERVDRLNAKNALFTDEAEDAAQSKSNRQDLYFEQKAKAELDKEEMTVLVTRLKRRCDKLSGQLKERSARAAELEESLQTIEDSYKGAALNGRLVQLEETALRASQELVEQGEKNFRLFEKLQKAKDRSSLADEELARARSLLLEGIAGPASNPGSYSNIPFHRLIELRLRAELSQVAFTNADARAVLDAEAAAAERKEAGGPPGRAPPTLGGADGGTTLPPISPKGGGKSAGAGPGMMALERELKLQKQHNRKLMGRLEQAEARAAAGASALDNVRMLKEKNADLVKRIRAVKDHNARTQSELRRSNERVQALSEHIEKLMVHLKHEAAAKAKAVDSSRKGERQVTLLKSRNGILARRNKARERVVVELREGARILEDQLRLMDEKYIELREKLDWTRAHSRREVRRIQQEANALRAKWALASGNEALLSPEHRPRTVAGSASAPMLPPASAAQKKMAATAGAKPSASKPQTDPLLLNETPSERDGSLLKARGAEIAPDEPWSDAKISGLREEMGQTK